MNKRVPEILCVWMISKLSCWQGGRRGMSAFGNMSMRHKNAFTVLVKGSPEQLLQYPTLNTCRYAPVRSTALVVNINWAHHWPNSMGDKMMADILSAEH